MGAKRKWEVKFVKFFSSQDCKIHIFTAMFGLSMKNVFKISTPCVDDRQEFKFVQFFFQKCAKFIFFTAYVNLAWNVNFKLTPCLNGRQKIRFVQLHQKIAKFKFPLPYLNSAWKMRMSIIKIYCLLDCLLIASWTLKKNNVFILIDFLKLKC